MEQVDNEALYRNFMLLTFMDSQKNALAKTNPCAWGYDIIGTYYKCNMTDIYGSNGISADETISKAACTQETNY